MISYTDEKTKGEVSLVRECELHFVGRTVDSRRITSSRDANAFAKDVIPYGPREHFIALFLDTRSRPLGFYRIQGSMTAAVVDPAEVYRVAIRSLAQSWIAIHNHPSDDPTPSVEDVALSDRLFRVGELIGIRMLDFVIVAPGNDSYMSFLDMGLLAPGGSR